MKPYKLAHQILSLTGINFTRQTVIGFTELTLIPTKDSFRFIWINCKQACVYKITLNDTLEVPFQYFDPLLEICPTENNKTSKKNLSTLNEKQMERVACVDPELHRGELMITISSEAQHLIQEGKELRVGIEFSLERPKAGLHFVVPGGDGTPAERGVHMFSYSHENSSRLWFPCIDGFNEVCTWRLEFTVDEAMVAVSCGELMEIVYTADMRRKTYHYLLNVPTSAPNIGLAVGPFKIYTDPYMNEITHFCLPQLLPVMKISSKHLHEAFEFFEEILSCRYPYPCYKQVYVDESYNDLQSYSTLSIVSINILCSTRIIDQVFETRKILVLSVAQQFFGCFISRYSWADAWLTGGISRYLMGLHVKKFFGFNEYKDWIHSELKEVIDYEEKYGSITLDSSSTDGSPYFSASKNDPTPTASEAAKTNFYFSVHSPHTCSPRYIEMYNKKAHLVIRMLEFKIGYELMTQVLNKHMSLGLIASEHRGNPSGWLNMVMSTATFTKTIFTVTGKDITVFCDQWVREGGHAKFKMRFLFNRKRNIVEMTLEQNWVGEPGIKRYVGPLVVWLQELDGTFKHTLQIEHLISKKEIVCHSKSRRNKKKKIPLCTGEEVDMDLSHLDIDSPVLWLRIDPDMTMMRCVDVEQPDNLWQYQLRHERDVTAQTDAIFALQRFARIGAVTSEMRNTLNYTIENDQCYYKVRYRAAHCLTKVANAMISTWNGPPAMMQIFKKMFGSYSCPNIIRLLDFTNFQSYFLLKEMPVAMAGLRNAHKEINPDVFNFLLDLFKYSDNSKNQFSDNYYRASLIDALAATVTAPLVPQDPALITSENMPENIKRILSEVTRCINLEKMLPCYKHTVSCASLRAIRTLQKYQHLPPKSDVFKGYAKYGVFIEVRTEAVRQLVDLLPSAGSPEDMEFLMDLIESDPVPFMRHAVIQLLASHPPFQMGQGHRLDTEKLTDRLWSIMNTKEPYDSRVRCGVMDLYFALYGSRRPVATSSGSGPDPAGPDKRIRVKSGFELGNSTPLLHSSPLVPRESTFNSQKPPLETPQPISSSLPPIRIKQEIMSDEEPTPGDQIMPPSMEHLPPFQGVRIKEEVVVDEVPPMNIFEEPVFEPVPFIPPPPEPLSDPVDAMDVPMDVSDFEVAQIPAVTSSADIPSDDITCLESRNPPLSLPSNVDMSRLSPLPHIPVMAGNSEESMDSISVLPTSVTGDTFTPITITGESHHSQSQSSSSTKQHKAKKKKKEKKHKKHKKHKHKLEKFAPEENLSSGSSNPPSPLSSRATSGHTTPVPMEDHAMD